MGGMRCALNARPVNVRGFSVPIVRRELASRRQLATKRKKNPFAPCSSVVK